MKTILKIVSVLTLLVAVIFFAFFVSARDLQFEKAKPPFVFQKLTNGAEIEIKIPKDSETETNILEWLKANSKGWKFSLTSYSPGKVIRGQNITVNFLADGVIVNFSPTGALNDWKQYQKPLTEKDSLLLQETEKQLAQ